MAQPEPTAARNREKSLNVLLDQLEARLGKLEAQTGRQAQDILHDLDAIQARFAALKEQEHLLRVERDQFEYLQNRLKKNSALVLRDLGGAARLQSMRAGLAAGPERWWWFLDEELAGQRRSRLKQLARLTAGGLLLLAVLVIVYRLFLAPDPAVTAANRLQNEAYQQMLAGSPLEALQSIDQAIAKQPGDPNLFLFKGILLEKLERRQEATAAYARAEQILGSREDLLASRSILNLQLDDPEAALADAHEVIAINPQSAAGHYYAGTALEALGKTPEALELYDQAFKLADEQGLTQLAATIKVASAMLHQSIPARSFDITPSPTP